MIIDSHCHLNILPVERLGDTEQVIKTAADLGVERMMCVAIGPDKWQEVIELADRHPQVYASIGIHPCSDKTVSATDEEILQVARHPKVLAIGEVGLDYFHQSPDQVDLSFQKARFRQHIAIAKQLDKPLVIHTRASTPDVLQILRDEGADQVGGIMHCFVEDLATAERAIELGFYISFSGILTFKNAKELKAVAQALPLDRILVETDAPYLAPAPYRSKINQPGYTRYVVEELARLRDLPFEQVAQVTTENFCRLFKLPY
ncbi:TatD family hydrolase [Thiomicrospira sp. R3]|uniref:TatD family hydrolase n=1 Tax=Thiomicrospira sp. R3 TaxID=3035472 RepID=UPI00259BB793|nr:TatD family hydrolase [Thiomicrospira sp. R3]WFE68768.1 TatD family hydrolase [Thiomicrospira sp. R3]